MSAVLTPAPAPAPARVPALRVTPGRVLRSEFTKFRSLRSTMWTLLAAVVLMIGLGALFSAVTAGQYHTFHWAQRAAFNPVTTSLNGVIFAVVAFGVLGVLLMGGEYSTGMIRSSLTAVPRRLPVLWGKVAVFAGSIFSVSLVASFVSFFLGQALLSSHHLGVSITAHDALRSVLGAALYLTVAGLIGVALGALLRHTAAGIPFSPRCSSSSRYWRRCCLPRSATTWPSTCPRTRETPSGAGRLSCLTRCPRGPASRCCADTPRSSSAPGHGGCDDRTPDRGDNGQHEDAQASRVPGEPRCGPLAIRRAANPAGVGNSGGLGIIAAVPQRHPPPARRGEDRRAGADGGAAGGPPDLDHPGIRRDGGRRHRRGVVGQAPGRRAGPAHRRVHGGRAAPAAGRAGVRRPARDRRGRPGRLARRPRMVVQRDLRYRPGRPRRRARAGPVCRHPARLPRRIARPRGPARTRARSARRARRGRRTRPDRPGDARRHSPPPDRHGHLERGGGRRVGQLAGPGRRSHAQRVGDRAARAGRYPPAPRRAAPAPRR